MNDRTSRGLNTMKESPGTACWRLSSTALSLLVVFFLSFPLGCIPEEEPVPVQVLDAKSEAITKAPWRLVSYKTRRLASDPWHEFESDSTTFRGSVAKCYLDDIYEFKGNGSVLRDNGVIQCLRIQSTIDQGNWTLDSARNRLGLTFFGIPVSWTINKLTSDSLQIETPTATESHQAIFLH